jgi:hypothetical protein
MKYVIDIDDNNTEGFLEILKRFSNVKAKPLSVPDAAILEEINHIKKAFKNLDKLKGGKLKTRPASALLNEL